MDAVATAAALAAVKPAFVVEELRREFPVLMQPIMGKNLVYLDNAATTQKPRSVLKTMHKYYTEENSNVHRGVHFLSQLATQKYDMAREKVRAFLQADSAEEIIFVRGTTEAINLVAQSYGRSTVREGDEIVISAMEHHSNIVPWQMLCEEKGARLRIIPMNDDGELLLDEYERLLNHRTKLVAIVHASNALGTVNPVQTMITLAHAHGIPVLVDGAQSVQHMRIDVRELDCDFFAFSGHKLYSPTGIGVLYGKKALLETMPPFMGGGDMILSVSFEKTVFNALPFKFEAGTPNIGGAIGLGAAIDFLQTLDFSALIVHENDLLHYASERLQEIPGLRIIGNASNKSTVLSFIIDGIHPHDIGTILDRDGIAIRAGHHCAQPVMQRFGIPATARASFAFYNTREDVDALVKGLYHVLEVFH